MKNFCTCEVAGRHFIQGGYWQLRDISAQYLIRGFKESLVWFTTTKLGEIASCEYAFPHYPKMKHQVVYGLSRCLRELSLKEITYIEQTFFCKNMRRSLPSSEFMARCCDRNSDPNLGKTLFFLYNPNFKSTVLSASNRIIIAAIKPNKISQN